MWTLLTLPFKMIFVALAAVAGNWVGNELRIQVLAQPGHDMRFYEKNAEDEITIAVNPLLTNLIPALAAGLLFRPGWLFAFLVGAALSAFVGDKYEEQFWALLGVE